MKILVNGKEISKLEEKLLLKVDEIYGELDYLMKLKDSLLWQGRSYDLFISKYNENIKRMEDQIDVLKIYVMFLDAFVNNYDDAMEQIKMEFKKIKGDKEWIIENLK